LLAGPANTSLPVIVVGDFNSPADGSGTPTYSHFIGAGFTDSWSATHPGETGNTGRHADDLRNAIPDLTQRIDFVLFRGDLSALDADVLGDELQDRTPSGLWPSDHAGVAARLALHVRPQTAGGG
jgi:endonuclease/exonuclease/phosphatase family metal-dependent hydrolase